MEVIRTTVISAFDKRGLPHYKRLKKILEADLRGAAPASPRRNVGVLRRRLLNLGAKPKKA